METPPNIIHIRTLEKYGGTVTNHPTVVKFTAPWCGPCKRLAPIYEDLSRTYGNQFLFVEVDIDPSDDDEDSDDIGEILEIKSIPLIVFYHDGFVLPDLTISGYNPELLRRNVQLFSSVVGQSEIESLPEKEEEDDSKDEDAI